MKTRLNFFCSRREGDKTLLTWAQLFPPRKSYQETSTSHLWVSQNAFFETLWKNTISSCNTLIDMYKIRCKIIIFWSIFLICGDFASQLLSSVWLQQKFSTVLKGSSIDKIKFRYWVKNIVIEHLIKCFVFILSSMWLMYLDLFALSLDQTQFSHLSRDTQATCATGLESVATVTHKHGCTLWCSPQAAAVVASSCNTPGHLSLLQEPGLGSIKHRCLVRSLRNACVRVWPHPDHGGSGFPEGWLA